MDDMAEIIQEFLVESHENLDQLDHDLVELEQDPGSRDLLSSVFRTIHTIKGTSGFLAFHQLESVTHVGENLLSRLRDGELAMTPRVTSGLLEMVDAVRSLLGDIERTGAEGDHDHSALIALLTALQEGKQAVAAEPPAVTTDDVQDDVEETPQTTEDVVEDAAEPDVVDEPVAEPTAEVEDVVVPDVAVEAPVEAPVETVAEAAVEAPVDAAADAPADVRRSAADSTIRVDVDLLDSLMNLVGELVLTRNQLVQRAATRKDPELLRTTHRLNLIAGELQEGVMKTRMQPIDTVWNKLPRVVRDLSVQLGKQVKVQMEGRDTELDKTILESVKDPLTHLVRNAVDHGIETPETRVAAGKPAEGTLTLRAFHEGGQVNIEICDDGAGIDPQRLRDRAVSRGILTPDAAARMTDREALGLIFAPGFSTAEKVTNVSGRGVGMDVVKTNIEKIGGLVDVHSEPGAGSTIRVKIPLTLAIIPALMISAGGNRYAMPQVNLLELVRIDGTQGTLVEDIQGTPVYRLRGRLLPLVSLREQLGLPEAEAGTTYIAVLQADDRQFGLVVDDINDTEEIVVKPLGKHLRHLGLFAGATIMGDGQVALILDAIALARGAGVLSDAAVQKADREAAERQAAHERSQLLLVGLGDGRQAALPLAHVDRLEEFPRERIERIGHQDVVQYRAGLLPLVHMDGVFGAHGSQGDEDAPVNVVVCDHRGVQVGFVVRQILDTVDAELSVRSRLDTGGHRGSAVINGKVTELVDMGRAVAGLDPAVFGDVPETVGV
ncbi:chemotaxis protein CheA [Nocardioides pocheonensis]|uniref:histidine kinase n=2 Tax=Nocardioides pocheonensis TaxID=661485 RepID=A0A3N0GQ40_9ACTN|nr:chemotaxis protein CheA [Nocardioides pocheonensis]